MGGIIRPFGTLPDNLHEFFGVVFAGTGASLWRYSESFFEEPSDACP